MMMKYSAFYFPRWLSKNIIRRPTWPCIVLERTWVAFPVLSKVVLQILAVPASSTASERDFNTVAQVCSPQTTSVQIAVIEDLMHISSLLSVLNDSS